MHRIDRGDKSDEEWEKTKKSAQDKGIFKFAHDTEEYAQKKKATEEAAAKEKTDNELIKVKDKDGNEYTMARKEAANAPDPESLKKAFSDENTQKKPGLFDKVLGRDKRQGGRQETEDSLKAADKKGGGGGLFAPLLSMIGGAVPEKKSALSVDDLPNGYVEEKDREAVGNAKNTTKKPRRLADLVDEVGLDDPHVQLGTPREVPTPSTPVEQNFTPGPNYTPGPNQSMAPQSAPSAAPAGLFDNMSGAQQGPQNASIPGAGGSGAPMWPAGAQDAASSGLPSGWPADAPKGNPMPAPVVGPIQPDVNIGASGLPGAKPVGGGPRAVPAAPEAQLPLQTNRVPEYEKAIAEEDRIRMKLAESDKTAKEGEIKAAQEAQLHAIKMRQDAAEDAAVHNNAIIQSQKAYNKTIDDIKAPEKVDPDRWWNSRNTAQKVFAIISAGLTKGASLQMFQHAIDQDIDAQQSDIKNTSEAMNRKAAGQLNEIQQAEKNGLNSAQARALVEANYWDNIDRTAKIAAMTAQAGSVINNAQLMSSMAQQKSIEKKQEFDNHTQHNADEALKTHILDRAQRSTERHQRAIESAVKAKVAEKAAGKTSPEALLEEQVENFTRNGEELKALIKKYGTTGGMMPGSSGANEMEQRANEMATAAAKMEDPKGVANKNKTALELKTLFKPGFFQTEEAAIAAIDAKLRSVEARRQTGYKVRGLKVPNRVVPSSSPDGMGEVDPYGILLGQQ